MENNPLIANKGIVDFPLVKAEHVQPAVTHLIAEATKILNDIEENGEPSWNKLMDPLEKISQMFYQQFFPVSHLLSVRNSDELRQEYEKVQPQVVAFGLRIQQSEPIYKCLKALQAGDEWHKLTKAQQRIVTKKIEQAEHSGIALTGEKRERFNDIASELSQLSTKFSNNVLDAIKSWEYIATDIQELSGMPENYLALAAQSYNTGKKPETPATAESGPWRITLDMPSYEPILKFADNRTLRERLYRAGFSKASEGDFDNTPLIKKILVLRQEQAKLLGFATYAALSTAEKMAGTVAEVNKLLAELRQASLEPGKREIAELQSFANEHSHQSELAHWDLSYWTEKQREALYSYNANELKKYFPLPKVLTGLFSLVERLFDIKVTPADGKAPVWNPDVMFFHITERSGKHLASFYLDAYSRPEDKRGGAWMNECVVRHRQNGQDVLPVAYLVCNFTPPINGQPSLLTFREVETLFHEFGHGLQHMLTEVNHMDAAGINGIEWDAVELPSQFMENWCYHDDTLRDISEHIDSKKFLPKELMRKLQDSRNHLAANFMLRQLQFALIDLEIHDRYDPEGPESVFDRFLKISQELATLAPLKENRFLCSFSHIFAGGYAAGYFSYKWAEVLSADAFSAFEDAGLDKADAIKDTGRLFRDTVLARGGGEHPMEVFKAFRGRAPSTTPLLRHQGLL